MKRVFVYSALLAFCGATFFISGCNEKEPPTVPQNGHVAQSVVDRVVDGDTVIVDGVRVRLIGIDSPEASKTRTGEVECGGKEATSFVEALLPVGTKVDLQYDERRTDRYDRTLAYLWKDGVLVNDAIVSSGWAQAVRYPPNVKYAEKFELSQKFAMDGGLGMWGFCDY